MRFGRLLMVLFALALTAFVACGGGNDEPSVDDVEDAVEDAQENAGDVADDVEDAVDDAGGIPNEDCLDAALALSNAAGGALTGDPGDVDASIDALRRMGDAAPDDLQDDFETLADALERYFKRLQDAGVDFSDPATFSDPEVAAELAEAAEELAGAEEASTSISGYMGELCDTN